jgi:hypothetical protein
MDLKQKFKRVAEIEKEMMKLEKELTKLFSSDSEREEKRGRKSGSKMSDEARGKIAEAQRKRWAKAKEVKSPSSKKA